MNNTFNIKKNNINWYPGHMTKARRMMEENIRLVDLIIEVLDARVPISSSNPDIKYICNNKPRIVVLNKKDLADELESKKWIEHFSKEGVSSILLDGRSNKESAQIIKASEELLKEKRERDKRRGIISRPFRAMVVGIPNVGKSTVINSLARKNVAVSANKPGVTKGKQWVRLNKDIELLDTPGLLWPKFDDDEVALNLSFVGAIKDNILDMHDLINRLIDKINNIDDNLLVAYYKIEKCDSSYEYIEKIGEVRGAFLKQNKLDYDKIYTMILDDFRNAKFGKITLEKVKK